MMRPTPRAAFLFALSIPAALLVLAVFRADWYLSFYIPFIILVLICADITMALPGNRLHLNIQGPTRLHVGEISPVKLELAGENYHRDVAMEALLELVGDAAPPQSVFGNMTDGYLAVQLPITPYRRGLLLGWVSLHNGDLVGGCGFDTGFRNFIEPGRGMPYFTRFQHFAAGLDYRTEETNFTLGLTELNARLKRRSLVILFTEFVDTISAELLLESLQFMVRRHVVVFVTLRDPTLTRVQEADPSSFQRVAEAVIADNFTRERAIVLERIARLGVHCLDVPAQSMSAALLNRYLMIKQRGLL